MPAMRSVLFMCLVACVAAWLTSASPVLAADDDFGVVTGKAIFNGQPVGAGKISLHPSEGKPIVAEIMVDGAFSAPKVAAGKYRVTLAFKGCPAKYTDPATSALIVEVKVGKNEFIFNLVD